MTHALTIAARDLRARWLMFLAAAGLSLVPFAAGSFPEAARMGRESVIAVTAGLLGTNFAIVAALIVGITMICSDLLEGRLSFYFARPVGPISIWFGKVTAAVVAVVVSSLIIMAPAALTIGLEGWERSWNISFLLLSSITAGSALLLILIAHAATTMLRSGSPLLVVDLLLAGVAIAAALLIVEPLLKVIALGTAIATAAFIVVALLVALIAAGAWQMSRGRVEPKRSHAELSKFLWIALFASLAVAGAFVAWVLSVRPADLYDFDIVEQSRGPWVVMSGASRGRGDYRPIFAYDTKTGESLRLASPPPWGTTTNLRGDTVAWTSVLHPWSFRVEREIVVTSLSKPGYPSVHTGVVLRYDGDFVLSDDGARLAVAENGVLAIHDVGGKRLLASVKIDKRDNYRYFFVRPDLLRLIQYQRWPRPGATSSTINISEFDVQRRTLTPTGSFNVENRFLRFTANADGTRLLATSSPIGSSGAKDILVLDGRTGTPLTRISDVGRGANAALLTDGRIIVTGAKDGRTILSVFSATGAPERGIDIGAAAVHVYVPPLQDPSRVLVMPWRNVPKRGTSATLLVDVNEGRVLKTVAAAAADSTWRPWFSADPRSVAPNLDQPVLLHAQDGRPILWNAGSGETRKISGS